MAKDPISNSKKSNTTETVKAYADEAKAPAQVEVKETTPEAVAPIPFPNDDTRGTVAQQEPAKLEEPTSDDDFKYPLEVILENARGMTGYENYVIVGAVAGRDETEYTVGQIEGLIQQFLNRPLS